MNCRFCGTPLHPERAEIYQHCTSRSCVAIWRAERLSNYRLDLVPKQGFAISPVTTVVSGRSSGR